MSTERGQPHDIYKAKKLVPLAAMWPIWIATKAGKSRNTLDGYKAAWAHIEPQWGRKPCSQITRAAFAAWLPTLTGRYKDDDGTPLPLGESSLRKVGIVMNALMSTAVDERAIASNPLKMKDVPQQKPSQRRYLSVAELDKLCDAMPDPRSRLVVEVLVRTGVRPGEAFGFSVGDLTAARGRLRVSRDVDRNGEADDTKTKRHRDVPVGGEFLMDLEDAADDRDRAEPLLLVPNGEGWTLDRWRPLWEKAAAAVGLADFTTYELRHTAASLAIHSGANVKTVQLMLGHRSAAMTLDIYGHLFEDELDRLPEQMDRHMKAERQRFADRRDRAQRHAVRSAEKSA